MTRILDPARPLGLLAHCPRHDATPLRRVAGLLVKDESARMGLGAFKALGGVHAVAALLGGDPARLASGAAGRGRVFTCASAGNHGMAVAAGARLFGARARVHLSATVPEGFARRLRRKGAQVVRSGATYEESVAAAVADAALTGATHLADASRPGYREPPRLVMEGYTVIAREMRDQIATVGDWPLRVYLQAGVGGLAAAMAETIRADWPVQPELVVVEPDAAPCLEASAAAGRPVTVAGPVSVMGRLDCKAPSHLAFEMLGRAGVRYETITEAKATDAADRSRALGAPSTPSGAAGLAVALREGLAGALVIITEGPEG